MKQMKTKAEVAPAKSGQHTPGPWKVKLLRDNYTAFELIGVRPTSIEEAWANARLISSAPELLKELKGLEAELRAAFDDVPAGVDAWMATARIAIAKATEAK